MGGMFSDYIIFWLTLEGERFFNRWPKWAVFDLLRLGIVSAPSSSPSFPPFALHCFPASQILWESRWGVPRPSCGLERWPAPFFFLGRNPILWLATCPAHQTWPISCAPCCCWSGSGSTVVLMIVMMMKCLS